MNALQRSAQAVLVMLLVGCAPSQPGGSLAVGARFPAPAGQRGLLVIPERTASIVVRVTGDKIPAGSVLQTTLTAEKATATFEAVPSGWKQVTARCYDAGDGLLASGETTVLIEPMRTCLLYTSDAADE